jgi:hypothetical protein
MYNTGTNGNKSEGHVTTNSKNHLNISIIQIRLLDAFFQYMKNIDGHQDPGRKLRAGSGRKAPEIAGTWKQYSHREFFGFFPMISDRFLPDPAGSSGRNLRPGDVSLGDVKVQLLDNVQDQSPSVKKIQESTVDQLEHDVDTDNNMKG